jgi:hypothetical protein
MRTEDREERSCGVSAASAGNELASPAVASNRGLSAKSKAAQLLTRRGRDDGMNTAEYAVGTLAAVAFAGLLLKVLTSDPVQNALGAIVQRALQ